MMGPPAFEKAMGICRYVFDNPGIGGIIKYRYEDFIVEEITLSGAIIGRDSPDFKGFLKPPRSGRYVYIALMKTGMNHYDAISLIARRLGVKSSMIGIAGIKDARAVTTQLISVKDIELEFVYDRLSGLKNLRILWACYGYGPLKPGMLRGNAFTITIRHVEMSLDELREHILQFIKNVEGKPGLLNFYGHQRFGIPRYSSHLVGKCMVQGDYECAVENLVGNPFEGEPEDEYKARQVYSDTKDPEKALKYMPKNLVYERRVLKYLKNNPGDYIGAMSVLPSSLLKLFVEAFASYIYNRFICRRISMGLPPDGLVEGDLIALTDSYGYPTHRTFRAGYEIDMDRAEQLLIEGKATQVLPVPGYMVKLSEGKQGEIEREILREEQVFLSDFRLYELRRKINVQGSYRRILFKPANMRLIVVGDDEFFPGKSKATIYFELGRGEYATILLRELMKPQSMWSYIGGDIRLRGRLS